jgi:hypothetical protein
MGPGIGLDAVKRRILHCLELNPGRPAGSASLYGLLIKIYKTKYLLAFCGYEIWSVTFRDKHRLRNFKNSVLGRNVGT